jgi:hypothetical protein
MVVMVQWKHRLACAALLFRVMQENMGYMGAVAQAVPHVLKIFEIEFSKHHVMILMAMNFYVTF